MTTASMFDQLCPENAVPASSLYNDPPPIPLTPDLDSRNEYPLDALGPLLGGASKAIAEIVQCPKAIAGQSVLAAASLAAQSRANVVIDGRVYPLSLFCLTVAESGDRKSAADRLALEPFERYQKELQGEHKEDLLSFRVQMAAYEKERSTILKNAKLDQTETELRIRELEEPQEPSSPIILVQEPTLEGLQKAFLKGQPSQAVFSDEGGQFFGGHAMKPENAAKSIAGLSKFWDASPITRTRAAEGETMMLYNRRLSIHLMVQPIIAQNVLTDSLLQGQGFLARFLIAAPPSIAGTRLYNHLNAAENDAIKKYMNHVYKLICTEMPVNELGELSLPQIGFSSKAKEAWVAAYNAIEEQIGVEGDFEAIKAVASKAAENIARIAGVLTVINHPGSAVIEENVVKCAAELMCYYLTEAVNIQRKGETSKELHLAQKLLSWMKEKGLQSITVRELSTRGPKWARSAKVSRPLVHLLQEYGWLIPIEGGVEYRGAKSNEAWRIVYHD